MKPRERIIAALSLREPDRVPVSPDINTLYCCKAAGKPFWEVLLNNDPPLWKLIVDIGRKQGFDTIIPCSLGAGPDDVPSATETIEETDGFKILETKYFTKKGMLTEQILYPAYDSPWTKKPLVENIEEDHEKVISMFTSPWAKSTGHFNEVRDYLGEDGIARSGGITVPTDHWLRQRGRISDGIMDYFNYPEIMDIVTESYSEYALELVEANCRLLKPDLLLIGGSLASMSLISPDMYIRYDLPFLQKATAICKKYNVPSAVHMCGKCREMLDIFASDTDLVMIEPLETLPGGNCSLKEVKEKYGGRLCLKGNINTYQILAKADAKDVLEVSVQCMEDAKSGGGFIFSSGDQVPYGTPPENLDMMVLAAKKYGRY